MHTPIFVVETIAHWSVEQLHVLPDHARTHSDAQIRRIAKVISEFGFLNPILAAPDGVIIAGHARWQAARALHMEQVPVIVLHHLSASQRRALALADNRLPLDAVWDEDLLRLQLDQLRKEQMDLEFTGFDDGELERLLAAERAAKPLTDEDAVPNAPTLPSSERGDLWILGEHRLLCGDATIINEVGTLMGPDQADLVFTDPPYGVDYEGYTVDRLKIRGDRMTNEEFQQFLNATFANYRTIVKPEASLYIFHPSSHQREFQAAMEQAGFSIRCQIVWVKNTFAWGFGRYKFQHEPIFYGHITNEKDNWYGDKCQSTVWQENKPSANREHPTAKPVALIERALINSTRSGDLVVDLFGGSGSTLIACERLRRKARLMEIDPRYVDVIIRRWQDYTGENARLAGDGHSYDEIVPERQRVAA